jgi:transposase
MSKTFRAWDVDQEWLLPPSLHDFVPADHLAHFVRETVRNDLDLSGVMESYDEERGAPPYHPAMMVALLLYGYSRGVYSSRQLARVVRGAGRRHGSDRAAAAGFPHDQHVPAAAPEGAGGAVRSGVAAVPGAGLVKLGHVALDGTKVKANASKHKAMSYGRNARGQAQARG